MKARAFGPGGVVTILGLFVSFIQSPLTFCLFCIAFSVDKFFVDKFFSFIYPIKYSLNDIFTLLDTCNDTFISMEI
jgi:hypothetical protein